MKLVVDHIKDTPRLLHIDEPVATFPLLTSIQNDDGYRITGNIQGDVTVVREYKNIRVTGRITVPLVLCCSRCLADYTSFVDTNFTLFFCKEAAGKALTEDELELGEMDLMLSTYTGDDIDLTKEIEEQVAMEIPSKPLCSEACKGLCHECGIDLNISGCSCSKEPVRLAFNALKDFKITAA